MNITTFSGFQNFEYVGRVKGFGTAKKLVLITAISMMIIQATLPCAEARYGDPKTTNLYSFFLSC